MQLFQGMFGNGTEFVTETGVLGQLNDLFQRVTNTVNSATGVTLSASQVIAGIVNRTGSAGGGFNDTTDTATNIIATISPNCPVNWAGVMRYINNGTGQTATIVAGTGVTVTGTATVANNAWRDFLITVTAPIIPGPAAVTLTNIGGGTI